MTAAADCHLIRSTRRLRMAGDTTRDQASQRLAGWLRDVAAGDHQALRAVMDATGERLLAEAMRLLKVSECAEEALQDTWLRVWHAASSFDPRVARPMTWLLRILQNRAIDMLRSQRRHRESMVELDDTLTATLADQAPGPEALLASARQQQRLTQQLQTLSHEQRQAMQLMLLRGFSHPEIAACCQVPESTARTWVRRGLMRLHASNDARAAAA